jgi:hypothetical protein
VVRAGVLLTGAVALALAGCGKEAEAPVPVQGKVVQAQGQPVADIIVTFHPQEEVNKGGGLPTQLSAKDGSFRLTCLRGRYKVTLASPASGPGHAPPAGSGPAAPPPSTARQSAGIPSAYRTPESTPWELVVPPGGTSDLVLTVK